MQINPAGGLGYLTFENKGLNKSLIFDFSENSGYRFTNILTIKFFVSLIVRNIFFRKTVLLGNYVREFFFRKFCYISLRTKFVAVHFA